MATRMENWIHFMLTPDDSWQKLTLDSTCSPYESSSPAKRIIKLHGYIDAHSDSKTNVWISLPDLLKCCGKRYNKASYAKSADHWSNQQHHGLKQHQVNAQWDVAKQRWDHVASVTITTTNASNTETLEPIWMVHEDDLKEMVKCLLHRTRKTQSEQLNIYKHLGIQLSAEEQATEVQVCIETQLVDLLKRVWPTAIETQFKLPGVDYRYDIKIGNLIIEIDEHGHSAYDPVEEKKRTDVLRQHKLQYLRFNPHQQFNQPVCDEFMKTVLDRWTQMQVQNQTHQVT